MKMNVYLALLLLVSSSTIFLNKILSGNLVEKIVSGSAFLIFLVFFVIVFYYSRFSRSN
jgi:uncharacterized membrane protein (DUF485 family)